MSKNQSYIQLTNSSVDNAKDAVGSLVNVDAQASKPQPIVIRSKNYGEAINEIKHQLSQAPAEERQKVVTEIEDKGDETLNQTWQEKNQELVEFMEKKNIEKLMKENEQKNFINILRKNEFS